VRARARAFIFLLRLCVSRRGEAARCIAVLTKYLFYRFSTTHREREREWERGKGGRGKEARYIFARLPFADNRWGDFEVVFSGCGFALSDCERESE